MTKKPRIEKSFSKPVVGQPIKPRTTARDLVPGESAYSMRERDREPDERIAALTAEVDLLHEQLWECAKSQNPEVGRLRKRMQACEQRIAQLMKARDRVCRLLHLRHDRLAFAEWLAEQKRPAPVILRYGDPVPKGEQDGYYLGDYEDWKRTSQADSNPPENCQVKNSSRQAGGIWIANVTVVARAKGRTKEEALANARLRTLGSLRRQIKDQ